jgi:predicted N-acyltransferase
MRCIVRAGAIIPKLLCAVPFTPVTGRRLLAAGPNALSIRHALGQARSSRSARQWRVSSAHLNFLDEETWRLVGASGMLLREDQQFHWMNRGYKHVRGFPRALSPRASARRSARERREAQEGLEIVRAYGRRPEAPTLGRVLPLLHGHGRPQMGLALSEPRVLPAAARAHGGQVPADPRDGRWQEA